MIGETFSRWTVIAEAERHGKYRRWLCRCSCGNEAIVWHANLKQGLSKSCGCLKNERTRERLSKPVERIWGQIDVRGPNECWPWIGKPHKSGYGHMLAFGKVQYAHRIVFILTHGDVSDDLMVLHNCDNRLCCNPNHLRLGTHQDNMDDMKTRDGRKRKGVGNKNCLGKITQEDADGIRSMWKAGGATQRQIADVYGITENYVCQIVGNRYYASS